MSEKIRGLIKSYAVNHDSGTAVSIAKEVLGLRDRESSSEEGVLLQSMLDVTNLSMSNGELSGEDMLAILYLVYLCGRLDVLDTRVPDAFTSFINGLDMDGEEK